MNCGYMAMIQKLRLSHQCESLPHQQGQRHAKWQARPKYYLQSFLIKCV